MHNIYLHGIFLLYRLCMNGKVDPLFVSSCSTCPQILHADEFTVPRRWLAIFFLKSVLCPIMGENAVTWSWGSHPFSVFKGMLRFLHFLVVLGVWPLSVPLPWCLSVLMWTSLMSFHFTHSMFLQTWWHTLLLRFRTRSVWRHGSYVRPTVLITLVDRSSDVYQLSVNSALTVSDLENTILKLLSILIIGPIFFSLPPLSAWIASSVKCNTNLYLLQ